MAVTFNVPELAAALRLNDSAEETAEVTRLLSYVSVAVVKHAPAAPDVAHDEAARRLAGYIFDQPEAARGDAYANGMRNSGAARMLLPYRIHRAGYTDAVTAAQAAVGTTGNPVTALDVVNEQLVVTFADGTSEALDLSAGMVGGADQVARDAADAAGIKATVALSTAETAEMDLETHETNHPDGTDQTARDAAAAAATLAGVAQVDIDDHEANHPQRPTSRHESTARTQVESQCVGLGRGIRRADRILRRRCP